MFCFSSENKRKTANTPHHSGTDLANDRYSIDVNFSSYNFMKISGLISLESYVCGLPLLLYNNDKMLCSI